MQASRGSAFNEVPGACGLNWLRVRRDHSVLEGAFIVHRVAAEAGIAPTSQTQRMTPKWSPEATKHCGEGTSVTTPKDIEQLNQIHTSEAIAGRLQEATSHSYLGDFVLGAVDGAVTTFAIVAGAEGAGFSNTVAVILGLANVFADGFSMAAGNFLRARADSQVVDRFRAIEEMHIEQIPDGEREEVRQIFASKGFEGEMLQHVVEIITQDRRRWVDTMLTEEWGLRLDSPKPWRAALSTFAAFLLAGMVPLLPLLFKAHLSQEWIFTASSVLTGCTFLAVGWWNGALNRRNPLLSSIETLLVGGSAAALAYFIGVWLRGFGAG